MKRKHLLGNRIFMALVFVFLYAPIFILIIFSFNAGNSSAVWKGFSLHWYAELFQNRLIMQSVYTTLLVSVLPLWRAPLQPLAWPVCGGGGARP